MVTKLKFMRGGRPARRGLGVSIHWQGHSSWNPFGGGHTLLKTDDDGCVTVDDALFSDSKRATDNVYIDNPDGGYSLKFPGVTIYRNTINHFDIEDAQRQ